ncbi:hypothetical protein ACHAQH_005894 [Verticillium albo-atrum]
MSRPQLASRAVRRRPDASSLLKNMPPACPAPGAAARCVPAPSPPRASSLADRVETPPVPQPFLAWFPNTPDDETAEHRLVGNWKRCMDCRSELVGIPRDINDALFTADGVALLQLLPARCIGSVDHFQCVLGDWWDQFVANSAQEGGTALDARYQEIVVAEFQTARIMTSAAGLRAHALGLHDAALRTTATFTCHARTIIDGSLEILRSAARLAHGHALVYGPETLFMRIAMASAFLVAGLTVYPEGSRLAASRTALGDLAEALARGPPDDFHPASHFANLLERCLSSLPAASDTAHDEPRKGAGADLFDAVEAWPLDLDSVAGGPAPGHDEFAAAMAGLFSPWEPWPDLVRPTTPGVAGGGLVVPMSPHVMEICSDVTVVTCGSLLGTAY